MGQDTSSGAMAWTLYEIANRPECVEHLGREIFDTVGPTAAATYSDLKRMKYHQHVINET